MNSDAAVGTYIGAGLVAWAALSIWLLAELDLHAERGFVKKARTVVAVAGLAAAIAVLWLPILFASLLVLLALYVLERRLV